ncbi:MAG: cyclase family protein [Limnochordales bacterium]|nr:cyclase family protein [Limnochordales bacterium]
MKTDNGLGAVLVAGKSQAERVGTPSFTLYDISRPIYPGMLVWKDKPEKAPCFTTSREHPRETRLSFDSHSGTHVDAPLHMIPGGAPINQVALERFVGSCRVVDLTHIEEKITRADLESVDALDPLVPRDFVLLKTRNSWQIAPPFDQRFVYLARDGAEFLAERGVRGVGIDSLGIERDQPGYPSHRCLLVAGIPIIEGLYLARVPAGRYFLVAAPLPLVGIDAAPARVFLIRFDEW